MYCVSKLDISVRDRFFHGVDEDNQLQWKENIYILKKIIKAPCGTLKLLLALGVAKYIKSYKIHFVVQYATDYCPLEHDNYKTISAHFCSVYIYIYIYGFGASVNSRWLILACTLIHNQPTPSISLSGMFTPDSLFTLLVLVN